MKTREERFNEFAQIAAVKEDDKEYHFGKACWLQSAAEQKIIDINNHWNWIKALAKVTMDVDISAYEDLFKNKAMKE